MTYNEWRDELKSNLLCVSESERRRVLDYYAEAYADRRDAGFTEREIIDDFGAPYDAAKKLLAENERDEYFEPPRREEERKQEKRREKTYERREEPKAEHAVPPPAQPARAPAIKPGENYMWVFVLLCIIFCVPLFGLVMTMVGITIGFCVAPFAVMIAGIVEIGAGIGTIVGGSVGAGLCTVGVGLICFGVSVILIPLFTKLVKLMWKLFNMFFNWLKSLFRGKEVKA